MKVSPITNLSQRTQFFKTLSEPRKSIPLCGLLAFLILLLASGDLFGATTRASRTRSGAKTTDGSDEDEDNGSDEDEPTYPDPPTPASIWASKTHSTGYYGGIHASGIGFQYWNNYMMMENLAEHLRNVPMVTYTGDDGTGGTGGTVPNTWNSGAVPPNEVGGYEYSTGGYGTAPYGPGYAPGYESGDPRFQTGYPVYQDGVIIDQQGNAVSNAPPLFRGQAAYGDPGTLIYSFWGGVIGGGGTIKDHVDTLGYKTKQMGGFVGLDLFGSCDCRSGVFYGYQGTELKQNDNNYAYSYSQTGDLFDPKTLNYEGEEVQYETYYDYLTTYNGTYNGKLKTNNHLIGLYHQFGSEFIYNIATLRFGFDRVKANQSISETGTTTGTVEKVLSKYVDGELVEEVSETTDPVSPGNSSAALSSKYNEYLGGVSLERGANLKFLSVMTFTPRGSLDYTYMFRPKFDETIGTGGVNHYDKKSYHSLRSQLGGDLAVDLYPGDGHLRILGRGGWIHEFLNYHYGKTSLTDFAGNSWSIIGNSTGRDWAVVGLGGEWAIVPAFMVFANYDLYKNKYLTTHYGDVGLKLMW